MTRIKVDCVMGHSAMSSSGQLVIDDSEECYRFTCPECGTSNEKVLTDRIRGVLRTAQVATVEELVSGASVVLMDDERIWEALEA